MGSAFIKASRGPGGYRFQAQVHDLRPVVRFIMGLLTEVEVRGGSELKQSLQNALNEHLKGG